MTLLHSLRAWMALRFSRGNISEIIHTYLLESPLLFCSKIYLSISIGCGQIRHQPSIFFNQVCVPFICQSRLSDFSFRQGILADTLVDWIAQMHSVRGFFPYTVKHYRLRYRLNKIKLCGRWRVKVPLINTLLHGGNRRWTRRQFLESFGLVSRNEISTFSSISLPSWKVRIIGEA